MSKDLPRFARDAFPSPLSAPKLYRLTRWIDENRAIGKLKTYAELFEIARSELYREIPELDPYHVKKAREDLGIFRAPAGAPDTGSLEDLAQRLKTLENEFDEAEGNVANEIQDIRNEHCSDNGRLRDDLRLCLLALAHIYDALGEAGYFRTIMEKRIGKRRPSEFNTWRESPPSPLAKVSADEIPKERAAATWAAVEDLLRGSSEAWTNTLIARRLNASPGDVSALTRVMANSGVLSVQREKHANIYTLSPSARTWSEDK